MSSGKSPMSLDEMFRQMPKMLKVADDMHRMTDYIGDLRLITIIMIVVGAIGGIGFFFFKYFYLPKRNDRSGSSSRRQSHYLDQVDGQRTHEMREVLVHGEKTLYPRYEERKEGYPPPPSMVTAPPRMTNGSNGTNGNAPQ